MTERLLKTNLWYKGLVTGHYLCRGVGEREKYVGKIKILLFPPPFQPPPPLSLQISSIYLSIIKIHATDNHKLITLCLTLTLGNALLLKCTSNCRPPSKFLHKKFSPPPPPQPIWNSLYPASFSLPLPLPLGNFWSVLSPNRLNKWNWKSEK